MRPEDVHDGSWLPSVYTIDDAGLRARIVPRDSGRWFGTGAATGAVGLLCVLLAAIGYGGHGLAFALAVPLGVITLFCVSLPFTRTVKLRLTREAWHVGRTNGRTAELVGARAELAEPDARQLMIANRRALEPLAARLVLQVRGAPDVVLMGDAAAGEARMLADAINRWLAEQRRARDQ